MPSKVTGLQDALIMVMASPVMKACSLIWSSFRCSSAPESCASGYSWRSSDCVTGCFARSGWCALTR